MNEGKIFEKAFAASVPDGMYLQRMIDPAQGYSGSSSLRFAPHQPYDYFVYRYPWFYALELKSTKDSLTFWRSDFEEEGKKKAFEIKKCQIEGLGKAGGHDGVIAGFVMNFRNVERTWFVGIRQFHEMTDGTKKKSINWKDVADYGLEIDAKKMKVNWRYDLEKMFEEAIKRR